MLLQPAASWPLLLGCMGKTRAPALGGHKQRTEQCVTALGRDTAQMPQGTSSLNNQSPGKAAWSRPAVISVRGLVACPFPRRVGTWKEEPLGTAGLV